MSHYSIILFLLGILAPPLRPTQIDSNECNEWKNMHLFNSTEYQITGVIIELLESIRWMTLMSPFLRVK